jgi:hypothetical protein
MDEYSHESVAGRERTMTRVTAALLGALFVFGCPLSLIIYPYTRIELAASAFKLWAFVGSSLLCAALGFLFIMVGVTGRAPLWFQRCTRQNLSTKKR